MQTLHDTPAAAAPAERAEAEREDVAHDVLHVARVAEVADAVGRLAGLREDRGAGARRLEEEAVAVVPEMHAARRQLVDRRHLAPQRRLHELFEARGVVVHHAPRLGEAQLDGVVAAQPRVVQRRLVGAQLDQQLVFLRQPLPQVHHVAQEADGQRLLL